MSSKVPRKTANANNGREFTSILPNDDVLFLVFAAPRLCQIAFEIRKQECALAIGLRALATPPLPPKVGADLFALQLSPSKNLEHQSFNEGKVARP
jgi:hypothetical protein